MKCRYELKNRDDPIARGNRFSDLDRAKKELDICINEWGNRTLAIWDRQEREWIS